MRLRVSWGLGRAARWLTPAVVALLVWSHLPAAQRQATDDPTLQTDADWVDDRWNKSEIGRFLCSAIDLPGEKTVKAIAVKLGERGDATICFDTELLRYSAGWTGGFVQFSAKRYGLLDAPKPRGAIEFKSRKAPGWARQGSFSDPRTNRMGNLPRAWGHYHGMYQSGNRVVFAYQIGSAEVLDSPDLVVLNGEAVFSRTFEVAPNDTALETHLCDLPNAERVELEGIELLTSGGSSNVTAVAVIGAGAQLTNAGAAHISFPSSSHSTVVTAIIWHGPRSGLGKLAQGVKQLKTTESLRPLTGAVRPNGISPW